MGYGMKVSKAGYNVLTTGNANLSLRRQEAKKLRSQEVGRFFNLYVSFSRRAKAPPNKMSVLLKLDMRCHFVVM